MRTPAPDNKLDSAEVTENVPAPALVPQLTRSELVSKLKEQWKTDLEKLGGVSALEDLEVLGEGLLDLTSAHPGGLAQFLAGRATRLSNLVRDPGALPSARRTARIVRSQAEALAQRSGLAAAYLAVATATWKDGEATRRVPVLLRPVDLEPLAAGEDERLTLESAIEINPVLARALRSQGALLDAQSLAKSAFSTGRFDATDALNRTEALGAAVLEDFAMERSYLIGAFLHPGQHLIEDIDGQAAVLEHHEIIGGLAGDKTAIETLNKQLPTAPETDRDPWEERGIGDLTNDQRHVMDAVASGMHLAVDVPAGGDSAGLVAGLIADAAASERSVLYVPARRHPAQRLVRRLRGMGMEDLVLDLPPRPGAGHIALQVLRDDLTQMAGRTTKPDLKLDERTVAVRSQLIETRTALSTYVTELHRSREPWDVSAYDALQAMGDLTSRGRGPRTRVRLTSQTVRNLNAQARLDVQNQLVSAAQLGAFSVSPRDTAWYGADLTTDEAAQETADTAHWLATDGVPTARSHAGTIASATGLRPAKTANEWALQLDLLRGVRESLDIFLPLIFERSVADLVAATATKQWRAEHGIDMPRSTRRRLRKQAKDLVRPGRPIDDLHAALVQVQGQRKLWQEQCPAGAWPRIPKGLLQIEAQQRELATKLEQLNKILNTTPRGADLENTPWDELIKRLRRLDDARETLQDLPRRTSLVRELNKLGLSELVADLANRKVSADRVEFEFQLAWWASVFEEILRSHPQLAQFDGEKLTSLTTKFRDLDLAHLRSQLQPIRDARTAHVHRLLTQHADQAVAFSDELAAGRVANLRDALVRFPDIARHLRPAWISSPPLVPQLLPHGRRVDVVIIDDAHSLPTAQAVGAIARARQVVVLGDSARAGAGNNLFADLSELLPRLEISGAMVQRPVEVAKFLAAHDFLRGDRALPSPQHDERPTLHVVDGRGMPPPGRDAIEGVDAEVNQVVDLVIEHALRTPHESLAVVTVSPRHAIAVREAILAEARASAAIQRLLEPPSGEALVICDITEVEGVWRDHVILSLGYAKTPHGRVLHRFGPAGEDDGRTQLLTAVAACRRRLSLVSCFAPDELDPQRLRAPGTRVLADLLDFAGGATPDSRRFSDPEANEDLIEDDDAHPQPDRLLLDVAERVWRRGFVVEPVYGVAGGVTIPLAIAHPDEPERFLVAVLTDDDDYIGEPSIRTRDRLRATELERLGWKVIHVWAAAAFMDPDGEVSRIERAVVSGRFPEKVHASTALPAAVTSAPVQVAVAEPAKAEAAPSKVEPAPAQNAVEPEAPKKGEPAPANDDAAPEPKPASEWERDAEPIRRATPRPPVMRGLKISEYGDNELDALSTWLHQTQGIKNEQELVAALRKDLGLKRRGTRIDTVLANAAKRALQQ